LALQFPEAEDAADEAEGTPPAERARAAVRGSGMPIADDCWADGRPSSRLACAAVAWVREAAPDRVLAYLHRVREATFVTGEPVDEPAGLQALADQVGGIETAALAAALEDGRAEAALADDLERVRAIAAELDAGTVEVRGELGRLAVGPRLAALGREGPAATGDEPSSDGVAPPEPAEGSDRDDDEPDAPETMVAPPAIRFRTDDRAVVADLRIGYQRLASVGGRAIPSHVESLSDKYGTGRLAMHLSRDVAEALSSREFVDEVRAFVDRFERVCLAEVAAGTGRSPATCRGLLQALAEAGVVEPVAAGETWRMIEGSRPPRSKG
jgi:hypothetical protein